VCVRWSLCHSLPIGIYGCVPPVIRLLVLAVMDGVTDACLTPLLVNLITDFFYNKMILTSPKLTKVVMERRLLKKHSLLLCKIKHLDIYQLA